MSSSRGQLRHQALLRTHLLGGCPGLTILGIFTGETHEKDVEKHHERRWSPHHVRCLLFLVSPRKHQWQRAVKISVVNLYQQNKNKSLISDDIWIYCHIYIIIYIHVYIMGYITTNINGWIWVSLKMAYLAPPKNISFTIILYRENDDKPLDCWATLVSNPYLEVCWIFLMTMISQKS